MKFWKINKVMKKIFALLVIGIFMISCVNQIKNKEQRIKDSLTEIKFKKIDSASTAKYEEERLQELYLKHVKDSFHEIEYYKTKAGKINKKHPNWTEDDCKRVANHEIWIGMDIEMVIYEKGNNYHLNESNYGNGSEYQYCFGEYGGNCFYTKDDGIVYAYN
jgi:hypothetical protein